MKDPYQVYGGLQDNSSWVGDSAYPGGISNQRWENLYGGDGFWAMVDPTDPDAVYAESQGGYIGRVNRRTHASRDIQPKAAYKEKLRFNWNTPIAVSPTQKGTMYLGAQFLFRSRDRGDTWERISPDLTTNDPEKQKQEQSGGVTVDNSSAEMHTTVYAISESPKDPQLVWVGTDDGNLQVTRDGGHSWTNVVGNVPGLPPASWVSWVEASRYDAGTAYAAFDRHTFGDMAPWVFRTTDFGKTWSRVVSPAQGVQGYAHVIKEDTVEKRILFLGTELGLWISIDAGATWAQFTGSDFPSVAVRDMQIHPRDHDLVLATHGRGIWILDDLTPLRAMTQDVLVEVRGVPARAARAAAHARRRRVARRRRRVRRPEPQLGGATINYYQRSRHVFGKLKLEVQDDKGKLVDTLSPSIRRGHQPGELEHAAAGAARAARRAARLQRDAGPARAARDATPSGSPTAGRSPRRSSTSQLDHRAPFGLADRKAQLEAALQVRAVFDDMSKVTGASTPRAAPSRSASRRCRRATPWRAKLQAADAKLEEAQEEDRRHEGGRRDHGRGADPRAPRHALRRVHGLGGQAGALPDRERAGAAARARRRDDGRRRDHGGAGEAPRRRPARAQARARPTEGGEQAESDDDEPTEGAASAVAAVSRCLLSHGAACAEAVQAASRASHSARGEKD